MRRRWWLVAGGVRHLDGDDGTPGGAQLPAPRRQYRPRSDATAPQAAGAARSDAPGAAPPACRRRHRFRQPPVPKPPAPAPVPAPRRRSAPVGLGPVRDDAVGHTPAGTVAVGLDAVGRTPRRVDHVGRRSARARARPRRAPAAPRGPAASGAARPGRPAPPARRPAGPRDVRPGSGATGADGQSTRSGSVQRHARQPRRASASRRERALRRAVLRFRGCLSRVPRSERRVLSLRAGVGRRAPAHAQRGRAHHPPAPRARDHARAPRAAPAATPSTAPARARDAGASATALTAAPGPAPRVAAGRHAPGERGGVLAEHQVERASKAGGSQGHRKPERAELSISRPPIGAPAAAPSTSPSSSRPLAILAFLLVVTREVKRADWLADSRPPRRSPGAPRR